jgi:hypothetical protein
VIDIAVVENRSQLRKKSYLKQRYPRKTSWEASYLREMSHLAKSRLGRRRLKQEDEPIWGRGRRAGRRAV